MDSNEETAQKLCRHPIRYVVKQGSRKTLLGKIVESKSNVDCEFITNWYNEFHVSFSDNEWKLYDWANSHYCPTKDTPAKIVVTP